MTTPIPDVGADADDIRVDAATAGGQVMVELAGLGNLRIAVSEAYFKDTPEHRLAADLSQAVRLLVARRDRAVERAYADGAVTPIAGSRTAAELDEFNRELEAFATEVRSPDGALGISTVGMREFAVTIEPGTRERYSIERFCRTAEEIGRELIGRRLQSMLRLRMEYHQRETERALLRPLES